MRRVIFSADDFGLTAAVNEAVERAHRDGILDQASLMVAGPAAADAIARARGMPSLRVGLHLVVIEGPGPPDQMVSTRYRVPTGLMLVQLATREFELMVPNGGTPACGGEAKVTPSLRVVGGVSIP